MAEDAPKKLSDIQDKEPKKDESSKDAAPAETDNQTATKAPEEEAKSDKSTTEENSPPPKKKGFRLPFPKFGKSKQPDPEPELVPETAPLTPEDLVNQLDQDISIHARSKQDRLSETMADQIKAPTGNQITLKFSKKRVILFTGVTLITAWVVILGSMMIDFAMEQNVRPWDRFFPTDSPQETENDPLNSVRIRDGSGGTEAVTSLADRLENDYGFSYVEIIEEEQLEEEVVTIYARQETYSRLLELLEGLNADYAAASGSAQLSSDSDFGIVIAFPGEEDTTDQE